MTRFILCILLLLMATSCASIVSGRVFFDTNGNGKLDTHESGAAGLKVTIKKEAETLGEAETDAEGNYKFEIEPGQSTGKAKYCVTVKLSSLYARSVATTSALSALASQSPSATGTTTDTTEEPGTETGPEEGETTADQPDTGSTTTTDSTSADGTEACREGLGEVKIQVAVAKQYQTMISQTSLPPVKKTNLGETTTLSICYPKECIPAPILFPTGVEPAVATIGFNPMTRQVILKNLQQTPTEAATVFPAGKIVCESLPVRTTREAETEVRLTPTAICPDDKVITLHPHILQINKTPDVTAEQKIANGSPALAALITVEATAKNNSATALPEAKLTMALPNFVTDVVVPTACNNLGEKVECKTPLLNPSGEMKMSVSFRLPAQINETATFKVNTSFSSSALESPVAAEEISFTIQGPPETDS